MSALNKVVPIEIRQLLKCTLFNKLCEGLVSTIGPTMLILYSATNRFTEVSNRPSRDLSGTYLL